MSGNAGYQKQSKTKRKRAKDHEDGRKKRFKNSDLPLSERLPKHGFPLGRDLNKNFRNEKLCVLEIRAFSSSNRYFESFRSSISR